MSCTPEAELESYMHGNVAHIGGDPWQSLSVAIGRAQSYIQTERFHGRVPDASHRSLIDLSIALDEARPAHELDSLESDYQ